MIKIGRCTYDSKGKRIDPSIPTFTKVLVLMKASLYWELSPYYLKDNKGVIMENKWQFSKVYPSIPQSTQTYSRYDKTVIWDHPSEIHVSKNQLTSNYWIWRKKGLENPHPVRYPVGYMHRRECIYALKENIDGTYSDKLDYIQARKEIYIPEYCSLVKKQKKFLELKNRLEQGENLLIVEVDGPHQESLPYYIGRYNVTKDFFINNTVDVTENNMKILLNDHKHNFGHGYCLGMALLDMDKEWLHGNAPTFAKTANVTLQETIKHRFTTALAKIETPKTIFKPKAINAIKKQFDEKMKKMPDHVNIEDDTIINKMKENMVATYVPLTTLRENIIDADEYDLMKDLESMTKSDLSSKNVLKDRPPKIKTTPKK